MIFTTRPWWMEFNRGKDGSFESFDLLARASLSWLWLEEDLNFSNAANWESNIGSELSGKLPSYGLGYDCYFSIVQEKKKSWLEEWQVLNEIEEGKT